MPIKFIRLSDLFKFLEDFTYTFIKFITKTVRLKLTNTTITSTVRFYALTPLAVYLLYFSYLAFHFSKFESMILSRA